VSGLAWLALGAPVAAFGIGWAIGYGYARAKDARDIGALQTQAETLLRQLDRARTQIGLLAAAPPSDDEFDRMLEAHESGP